VKLKQGLKIRGITLMKYLLFLLITAVVSGCDLHYSPDKETTELAAPRDSMALKGMFRYMADAAMFRDCRTGKSFPVAMVGPYIELESAYSNSAIEPGAELKVAIHGRYLERLLNDDNLNEIMLIVDSFDKLLDSNDCEPTVHADLTNTYWKLVELNGASLRMSEGSRETHLILALEESRVHGFAGCNNFFGTYEARGESLSFSALGSTRMACPQGMESESAFLQALGVADRATVSGMFMSLFSGEDMLARFEAVYLP
jgi:copper homeostasis protein (lipoprotein)